MWMDEKKIKEQRESLLQKSKGIVENAKKEDRELSTEDREAVNAIHAEVQKLNSDLETLQKQASLEEYSHDKLGRRAEEVIPSKDLRGYSVLKAIREQMKGGITGLEKEVSDELAHRNKKEPQGFYMPFNLPVENRDLNLTTGTGAKAGTVVDASNFISLLRNKMLVGSLGARMLDGMVGDFSLPRQSGGGTAYWVTEGNAPTESNQTADQVNFVPSTVGAFTDITRKFILQSSLSAEEFVRNDLATVLALELDRIAYNGSGSGAEPEGIIQNSSVTTVAINTNGGAPTFAKMVELESAVATNNADIGSLAYVTTPYGRGELKTTAKDAGSGRFLWENNQVNGYDAYATNQVPSDLTKASGNNLSAVIFGNFNDIVYAFWSAVDVLVDPYTASTSGTVRIVCLQDCDMQLRHNESFAKIVDLYTDESSLSS